MESLISFDGASDVMNNLINKLSDGIGWIATHDTPMCIAVDTYIQDIQNSNFDPVTKAVLISNARKPLKSIEINALLPMLLVYRCYLLRHLKKWMTTG